MQHPMVTVNAPNAKVKLYTRKQLHKAARAKEKAKAQEQKTRRAADKYMQRGAAKVDAALEGCNE